MKAIDTHHHFWIYSPQEYEWIDGSMEKLQADYLPEQFQQVLEANNIAGCIAVQARQTLDETRWLLKLADKHSFIKGVIGWVDLCSSELSQQLVSLSNNSKLKGFRHVLQGEEDQFMLQPEFIRGVKLLGEQDYCYEILVHAEQLTAVNKLISQLPGMRLVIDHIAKPDLRNHSSTNWFKQIEAISGYQNVYCKLSGMVTEADWENWKPKDITPYIDHVIQCFGIDRVMFGSDWPVCLLASSYKGNKNLIDSYIAQKYPAGREQIFSKNAQSFYRLAEDI